MNKAACSISSEKRCKVSWLFLVFSLIISISAFAQGDGQKNKEVIGHLHYTEVEIDLYNNVLIGTKTLPFDVPFYLKGKVNEQVSEIEIEYTAEKSRIPKIAKWSRASSIFRIKDQADNTFHVLIEPLNPNEYYTFRFKAKFSFDSNDSKVIGGLAEQYLINLNNLNLQSYQAFLELKTGAFLKYLSFEWLAGKDPQLLKKLERIDRDSLIKKLVSDYANPAYRDNRIPYSEIEDIGRAQIESTYNTFFKEIDTSNRTLKQNLQTYYKYKIHAPYMLIFEDLLKELYTENAIWGYPEFERKTKEYIEEKYGNGDPNSTTISFDSTSITNFIDSIGFQTSIEDIESNLGLVAERVDNIFLFRKNYHNLYLENFQAILNDQVLLDTFKKHSPKDWMMLQFIKNNNFNLHDTAIYRKLHFNNILFSETSFLEAIVLGFYSLDTSYFKKYSAVDIRFSINVEQDLNKVLENLDKNFTFISRLIDIAKKHNLDKTERLQALRQHILLVLQLNDEILSRAKAANEIIRTAFLEKVKNFTASTSQSVQSTSTADFLTRSEYYISADLGFTVPFYSVRSSFSNSVAPYFGVNFNLFPINRQARYSILDKDRSLFKSLSVMVGMTFLDGFPEDGPRRNLFKGMEGNLATGMGLRISDFLRFSAGGIWYRYTSPRTFRSNELVVSPFISLSLDIDVKERLKDFGKIFSRGK